MSRDFPPLPEFTRKQELELHEDLLRLGDGEPSPFPLSRVRHLPLFVSRFEKELHDGLKSAFPRSGEADRDEYVCDRCDEIYEKIRGHEHPWLNFDPDRGRLLPFTLRFLPKQFQNWRKQRYGGTGAPRAYDPQAHDDDVWVEPEECSRRKPRSCSLQLQFDRITNPLRLLGLNLWRRVNWKDDPHPPLKEDLDLQLGKPRSEGKDRLEERLSEREQELGEKHARLERLRDRAQVGNYRSSRALEPGDDRGEARWMQRRCRIADLERQIDKVLAQLLLPLTAEDCCALLEVDRSNADQIRSRMLKKLPQLLIFHESPERPREVSELLQRKRRREP